METMEATCPARSGLPCGKATTAAETAELDATNPAGECDWCGGDLPVAEQWVCVGRETGWLMDGPHDNEHAATTAAVGTDWLVITKAEFDTYVHARTLITKLSEVLPDLPVFVEQTGGGVATLYMGAPTTDTDGRARYKVVAGPGAYHWTTPALSSFAWVEFMVGPDDDGETMPDMVNTMDEFVAAVQKWATR